VRSYVQTGAWVESWRSIVMPEICYLLAPRPGHGAMRRFLQERWFLK
jgi:hypothetical protein